MASAAILAGGSAVRLGGLDKSAIVVAGRSILDRQLAELTQVSDDIMIVGGRQRVETKGVRTIADRIPHSGPLGGLDAALAAARDDQLVVVACDMPFITAALLGELLRRSHWADAVVPRTERGYHPLCAVYTRACHAPVMRRLAEHRLAIRGLLEDVHVQVVEPSDLEAFGDTGQLLANVNTPGDLEALLGHEQ